LDVFELANFNRQYGAAISTLDQPKSEVMERAVKEINPDAKIVNFKEGITMENLDDFLNGVDIYVDSLDIFALEIRRAVFAKCYELGIPTITAAPMGMGTAILIFMPGKMDFETYFDLEGYSFEEQVLRFIIGVSPTVMQRKYLVDRSSVNFLRKKVPSTLWVSNLPRALPVQMFLKFYCEEAMLSVRPVDYISTPIVIN